MTEHKIKKKLDILKEELEMLRILKEDCLNAAGVVLSEHKWRYQHFIRLENSVKEDISVAIKSNSYAEKLMTLTDEQLGHEFAEWVGDELGEFNYFMHHYGRQFVEQYLIDVDEVARRKCQKYEKIFINQTKKEI